MDNLKEFEKHIEEEKNLNDREKATIERIAKAVKNVVDNNMVLDDWSIAKAVFFEFKSELDKLDKLDSFINGHLNQDNKGINNQTNHDFAVDELVELANGERLYICKQTTGCDGTPLYNLGIHGSDHLFCDFPEEALKRPCVKTGPT